MRIDGLPHAAVVSGASTRRRPWEPSVARRVRAIEPAAPTGAGALTVQLEPFAYVRIDAVSGDPPA